MDLVPKNDYKFVDTWKEDDDYPERIKLNQIVQLYNNWQINEFDSQEGRKVRGHIIRGLQTFATGQQNYTNVLNDMLSFVEGILNSGD